MDNLCLLDTKFAQLTKWQEKVKKWCDGKSVWMMPVMMPGHEVRDKVRANTSQFYLKTLLKESTLEEE